MMYVFQLLKLALLAGVTVSLWTVRVALTAHGRRYASALVATVEAIAFATVFAQALDSIDSPTRLAAYGVGVGTGTLAGLAIDQCISSGSHDTLRRTPAGLEIETSHREPSSHVIRTESTLERAAHPTESSNKERPMSQHHDLNELNRRPTELRAEAARHRLVRIARRRSETSTGWHTTARTVMVPQQPATNSEGN